MFSNVSKPTFGVYPCAAISGDEILWALGEGRGAENEVVGARLLPGREKLWEGEPDERRGELNRGGGEPGTCDGVDGREECFIADRRGWAMEAK